MENRTLLSVLVPTRNCGDQINGHLENLRSNLPEGAEIVFVDSESTDGTQKVLEQAKARFPSYQLLQHPPGLYASWNAGIEACSGEWIYIATVGDRLLPGGMDHLLAIARSQPCDIVLSPPVMKPAESSVPEQTLWPIHHLVAAACPDHKPSLLTCEQTVRWLCGFLPETVLGSAASNLYRGDFLREHPFPVDFGHEGDAAWGVLFCREVSLCLTPLPCAEFSVHGRGGSLDGAEQTSQFQKLKQLAESILSSATEPWILPLLGEFRARWERETAIWAWLCRLDGVAQTGEEQRKYISCLEQERIKLKKEIELLGEKPVSKLLQDFRRRHLAAFLRPLRRLLNLDC